MKPQTLGALIKRTGVMKSENRKGNFYNYNTEGYSLTRQYGNRYTVNYYQRLTLGSMSDSQRESFNERRENGLALITQALEDKGIKVTRDGDTLWIELENLK